MSSKKLDLLIQIAKGIAAEFGNNCEVVVHDLAIDNIEHSIVHIENGHITNRKIGDSPSCAVLDALNSKHHPLSDHLAYLTKTESGHILKSSTLYIPDEDGNPRYVLAINYDITSLLGIEASLSSLTSCPIDNNHKNEAPTKISNDINKLLDNLMEESVALVGVPVALMSKDDKIKAIQYLNDAGAFLITKSGDKVSNYFNISKFTLYSYLKANK